MKQKVLFVCLGNICRSPMAEEIFRQKVFARDLGEKFEIDSAGTYSGHAGELADPRMREAAHCRGYCLTHRSRPFRVSDFEEFDRIVVMDDSNYERV
ncbi:MAG: low molecular weight phosphotyrosine protein phosphatase, partial [Alistipes sp.]|nr:low molecular weight phosphotyrosine protein phosphatase [Alistipes sp.]